MPSKDDLLNLENKKPVKKPLIYGAIAFLVFIIGVLGFAIYNNATSKQDSVVLPPQIQEEKQGAMFKEVPIETTASSGENINLADKLIKNENNDVNDNKEKQKEVRKNISKEKTKTEIAKPKLKKEVRKKTLKNKNSVKYYVQVAALMKYKKPNQNFLNLIKKEGYEYKLYETSYIKNGKKIEIVKILIGPFDEKDISKEVKKIKNNITQNAFIFKVK